MRRRLQIVVVALLAGVTFVVGCNGDEDGGDEIDASVSVEDQTVTRRRQVTVESVSARNIGWVVILDQADDAEEAGTVIGHAQVERGTTDEVTVELGRDLEDGETLYARLHNDTGEQGTFEFGNDSQDLPVVDEEGNTIVESFEVSFPDEPRVEVEDQTLEDAETVTVPLAVVTNPGWLVIHEQASGSDQPGALLGHARLKDGPNRSVEVELDREVEDGEVLYAMLHDDTGEEGTFEFGEDNLDPPIEDADGNVVVESFEVEVE